LADFFDENIDDEKVRVVMESSSVWYNIYSYLSEEKHLNVVLSNPVKTRAIASAKLNAAICVVKRLLHLILVVCDVNEM
jgi:transposase